MEREQMKRGRFYKISPSGTRVKFVKKLDPKGFSRPTYMVVEFSDGSRTTVDCRDLTEIQDERKV